MIFLFSYSQKADMEMLTKGAKNDPFSDSKETSLNMNEGAKNDAFSDSKETSLNMNEGAQSDAFSDSKETSLNNNGCCTFSFL